jgi:hypothetical protein
MMVGGRAIGGTFRRMQAARLNGGGWSIELPPSPPSSWGSNLAGVSCTSASSCIAVGGYYTDPVMERTLIERWNGTKWAIVRSPALASWETGSLASVSCQSAAACTAVGSYDDGQGDWLPLAERWNGTRWSIQRPAIPRGAANLITKGIGAAQIFLSGVSCPSKTVCVASGRYTLDTGFTSAPLVERWSTPN